MVEELPAGNGRVELVATRHIGLINEGDDLASLIAGSVGRDGIPLQHGDILVIAQKIVSKVEGRYACLDEVIPSARALELASICEKDARLIQLILGEAREVLRCVRNVIVVENHHGIVLANAGIDRSNVEQTDRGERVLLLPKDPDASAAAIREKLMQLTGARVGVVINDSIGRAWRMGTVGTAIGVSGLGAVQDKRGEPDLFGFRLRTTEVGHADELAAAASLVMGQGAEGTPVVLIRGLVQDRENGQAADLIRPRAQDLFR